jgi:hypothetical protein
MTTTVRDIVVGALKRLSQFDAASEPTAEDVADGLTAFNDMVLSWPADGLHTGVGEMILGQPLPFEDMHREGLKALLAVRLAPDYEMQVSAALADAANRGWTRLQADFLVVEPSRVDAGLLCMPSSRSYRYG